MMKIFRLIAAVLFVLAFFHPLVHAEEPEKRARVVDEAGVATGVTVGNSLFVPIKVALLILAAPQATLAWVFSAGDTEQAKEIFRAQTEGPYFISSRLARKSVERPVPVETPEYDSE